MADTWMNGDNLYIKFGTKEGTVAKGGQILAGGGTYRTVEFDLSYSDLAATAGIMHDTITIPKNARIDKVEVVTKTAFDSAADAFVFNLGLIKASDRSTEVDFDGLVAALPQASMDPAGDYASIDVNHTYKGALIGTTTAYKSLITADYDTAAPTIGVARIRIMFYMIS